MNKEFIKVWKEDFAIVKSKKFYENAFANIKDGKELTVIINQNKTDKKDIIKIDKNWKLITIDIVFKFNVVGVTAKISGALAKEGISILPVAAYSRDHILVKKNNLNKAIKILQKLKL